MRNWEGIQPSAIDPSNSELSLIHARDQLIKVDSYLRDIDGAMKRVQNGYSPSSSGGTTPVTPDLSNYAYLPGRAGGQTLRGGDASGGSLLLYGGYGAGGKVYFGPTTANSYFDVSNNVFNINDSNTNAHLRVVSTSARPAAEFYGSGSGVPFQTSGTLCSLALGNTGYTWIQKANSTALGSGYGLLNIFGGSGNTDPLFRLLKDNVEVTTASSDGNWTFSGLTTFADDGSGNRNVTLPLTLYSLTGGTYFNDSSGFYGRLSMSGNLTADRTWQLPDGSGAIVVAGNNAQIFASTASEFRSNTASLGACFEDTTTTSKKLRAVLSGAVGNNSFTLTNTAARNYGFGNISGNVAIVGDDPPSVASGNLGKVDDTGKTADTGTTNLSSTPPTGMYRVDVILMTTTAGGGSPGTQKVTIGWTDNVGATTYDVVTGHALNATGRSFGSVNLRVSSSDITYAVTNTGGYGSGPGATYATYIRVTFLG